MATIGEQLKAARETKGVSESEAGEATRILTKVISAMEADNFSVIAAPAYAKGFIRLYSKYLEIDPEPLLQEYSSKFGIPTPNANNDVPNTRSSSPIPPSPDSLSNGSTPGISDQLRTMPPTDIRIVAGVVAGVLVLIMLIASVTNYVLRKLDDRPTPTPPTAGQLLLEEPLPDLYLVEHGKIESTR